jgi:hypothetical protein
MISKFRGQNFLLEGENVNPKLKFLENENVSILIGWIQNKKINYEVKYFTKL